MDVMTLRRNLLLNNDLPFGYKRLQYLESNGNQYINLGYYLGSKDKVKIDVNVMRHNFANGRDVNYILGYYSSGKKYAIQRNRNGGGNSAFLYDTWDSSGGFYAYPYQTIVHIEVSKDGYFLDGNLLQHNNYAYDYVSFYLQGEFTTSAPAYLLWANGTSQDKAIARIYSFVIEDNNGIQMNLIPCVRKSDNKPGMYDKVSGAFLTNQGTGEFIIPS